MKVFITYNAEAKKEGFETRPLEFIGDAKVSSIDELAVEGVAERLPGIIGFVSDCYRILKPGGVMVITAPYYASSLAWAHPENVRGVSEATFNFANRDWREKNGCRGLLRDEVDFEVVGAFSLSTEVLQRSNEAKNFWLQKYNNVVQAVIFTLTKKGGVDVLGEDSTAA